MVRKSVYLFVSILTVCVCAGEVVADLEDGLVSHWKLDEGAGNTAYDSAGTSDGQLVGSANWAQGYLSEGIFFKEGYDPGGNIGSQGYIACPSNPAYNLITRAITLSCWVKPEPDPIQNWNYMVLRGGPQNETFALAWLNNAKQIAFRTTFIEWPKTTDGVLNWQSKVSFPDSFLDGGWHHVAGTYDGATKIVYVDGQEIGQFEKVGTIEASTGRILMGGSKDEENPKSAAEHLDDVRIYDRALSVAEVAALAGAEQVFTGKATGPNPIDRSTIDETAVRLEWTPAYRADGTFSESDIVYLGTDYDLVSNGDDSVKLGQTVDGFWDVQDLIPGSTYYWRVDEVYADGQVFGGYIWQFTVASKKASAPTPADGAIYVDPNSVLSWAAGLGATSHVLHIGTDQAAVANAATADGVTVAELTYSPGPLDCDTTYYWRVDAVGAEGTFNGDLWSFTTGPDIPVTNPDLVGWWTLDETPDDYIIDASGHHHHGQVIGGPALVADVAGGNALEFNGQGNQFCRLGNWVPSQNELTVSLRVKWTGPTGSSQGLIAKRNTWGNQMWTFWAHENGTAVFEVAKETLDSERMALDAWEHWAVTFDGQSLTAVIYHNSLEVARGTLTALGNLDAQIVLGAMEAVGKAAQSPFNGALDDVRIYNRVLTAAEIQQLARIDMLQAWNPTPASGAIWELGFGQDTFLLSWLPGEEAAQHDVYFGTDESAVETADISDTTGVYRGRQAATSYTPRESVEWGQSYYWRIDEYNTDATISTGRLWSLTVADYLVVDDFEDYNDYPPDEIFNTWIDGYGVETNGSTAGYAEPDFLVGEHYVETTIVHGGSQSMPLFYDNNFKYSEATMTLVSGRDWTEEGVGVLSLWFRGSSDNAAERMYVALNGSAVVYHINPDAALIDEWTQWTIDLQEFAAQGVNLANVNTISIGFGDKNNLQASGLGMVFFDDIRLYRPAQ